MPLTEGDRVKKELDEVNATEDFSAEATTKDLSEWTATIKGPKGTPYEGGVFKLELQFPAAYGERAPQTFFITKVYHPNVDPNNIQLNILTDGWRGAKFTALTVLQEVVELLKKPILQDALNKDIAEQYENDQEAFNKEAKQWTENFAKE